MVNVRDNIPSNLVKLDQKFENFEAFFIELELSKKTNGCLVIPIIHIKVTQNNTYLISAELISKYDNILIIGDLNYELSEPFFNKFCKTYSLESIENRPTVSKILRILHALT